jgi:hypothetical protein
MYGSPSLVVVSKAIYLAWDFFVTSVSSCRHIRKSYHKILGGCLLAPAPQSAFHCNA